MRRIRAERPVRTGPDAPAPAGRPGRRSRQIDEGSNIGESCIAANRIYVEEPVREEFTARSAAG